MADRLIWWDNTDSKHRTKTGRSSENWSSGTFSRVFIRVASFAVWVFFATSWWYRGNCWCFCLSRIASCWWNRYELYYTVIRRKHIGVIKCLLYFIAKLVLGDVLKEGATIAVNPLVIWAWAGLLINAINSIPAGELDGGRISFAIWGRKVCFQLKYI